MIELLKKLYEHLDSEANKIATNIMNGTTYASEVFDSPLVFETLEQRPWALRGKKGIYVFMITEDIPLTTEQVRVWNSIKGAGFTDWFQGDLHTGDCLYVGSCVSESLYVRIRQHFLDTGEATALKLGHNARNVALKAVKVYAYPMRKELADYYRLILPAIEKRLHIALRPKAGSSRV